jgi:hypothetical protein
VTTILRPELTVLRDVREPPSRPPGRAELRIRSGTADEPRPGSGELSPHLTLEQTDGSPGKPNRSKRFREREIAAAVVAPLRMMG